MQFLQIPESSGAHYWIEVAALGLETFAVAIIVIGFLYGTVRWGMGLARGVTVAASYLSYRAFLGRTLLLGLEVLVAGDIVRTVALDPSLNSVAVLGILVVIRTFLSWSLVVEIEGRWPWQKEIDQKDTFQ